MHVEPYLIFPGTCRAALEFYTHALDGVVEHLQTVGESPLSWAPEHADRVFNSTFSAAGIRFRASDGEPGNDLRIGHNFAMFVVCPDAQVQQRIFAALGEDGRVLFPLADGFGMVEDRFEIRWMIDLQRG